MESWPGWTDEDVLAVTAAAREIETFEEALPPGMREAFSLGRAYGKREDALDRLDSDIPRASRRVAQEAWGPRSAN